MPRRHHVVATLMCLLPFALTACSPAVDPALQAEHPVTSTQAVAGDWQRIIQAADKGKTLRMFKVKADITFGQGPTKTAVTAYGYINAPDTVLWTTAEAGQKPVTYYQQGEAAYYGDASHWRTAAPRTTINPYFSYSQLVDTAAKHNLRLVKLPRSYVIDEYCNVYQTTIPAALASGLSAWAGVAAPPPVEAETGDVQYTFYVGQKDGYLREVKTLSAAGIGNVGSLQTQTDAVMYYLNRSLAKAEVPTGLNIH